MKIKHAILTWNNKQYLGIPIGEKRGKMVPPSEDFKTPGLIIRGEEIIPWNWYRIIERDSILYILGDPLEVEWAEHIIDYAPERGIFLIRLMAESIHNLIERETQETKYKEHIEPKLQTISDLIQQGKVRDPILLHRLLFTCDNALLILPTSIADLIKRRKPEYKDNDMPFHCIKPSWKGEAGFIQQCAAMLYQVLTKTPPFDTNIQYNTPIKPPKYIGPTIKTHISETITKILTRENVPTLTVWCSILKNWEHEKYFDNITPAEEHNYLALGAAYDKKAANKNKLNKFFFYNKSKLIIAGVVFALFLFIAVPWVRRFLEPPITTGMLPKEIVELFYTSINTLDHEKMSGATTGRAGRNYINEVARLFAVTRVRSYYGDGGIVDAAEWKKEGKPELSPGYYPYGVTSLQIEPSDTSDASDASDGAAYEETFIVTFIFWLPGTEEEPGPETIQITDKVTLNPKNDTWFISNITLLQQEKYLPDH